MRRATVSVVAAAVLACASLALSGCDTISGVLDPLLGGQVAELSTAATGSAPAATGTVAASGTVTTTGTAATSRTVVATSAAVTSRTVVVTATAAATSSAPATKVVVAKSKPKKKKAVDYPASARKFALRFARGWYDGSSGTVRVTQTRVAKTGKAVYAKVRVVPSKGGGAMTIYLQRSGKTWRLVGVERQGSEWIVYNRLPRSIRKAFG